MFQQTGNQTWFSWEFYSRKWWFWESTIGEGEKLTCCSCCEGENWPSLTIKVPCFGIKNEALWSLSPSNGSVDGWRRGDKAFFNAKKKGVNPREETN
jgi:hypothetical protein